MFVTIPNFKVYQLVSPSPFCFCCSLLRTRLFRPRGLFPVIYIHSSRSSLSRCWLGCHPDSHYVKAFATKFLNFRMSVCVWLIFSVCLHLCLSPFGWCLECLPTSVSVSVWLVFGVSTYVCVCLRLAGIWSVYLRLCLSPFGWCLECLPTSVSVSVWLVFRVSTYICVCLRLAGI